MDLRHNLFNEPLLPLDFWRLMFTDDDSIRIDDQKHLCEEPEAVFEMKPFKHREVIQFIDE